MSRKEHAQEEWGNMPPKKEDRWAKKQKYRHKYGDEEEDLESRKKHRHKKQSYYFDGEE